MYIIKIIAYVILLITSLSIIILINAVAEYFGEKTKLEEKKNESLEQVDSNKNNVELLRIDYRVDVTNSIINTCIQLIQNEIVLVFRSYTTLNTRYELLKLDKDVEIISTNVFNAIKPEVIQEKNLVITSEYLMKFIISETTLLLLNTAKEYNAKFSG